MTNSCSLALCGSPRTADREHAPRLKSAENANIQPNPGLILRAEPTVTNILKVSPLLHPCWAGWSQPQSLFPAAPVSPGSRGDWEVPCLPLRWGGGMEESLPALPLCRAAQELQEAGGAVRRHVVSASSLNPASSARPALSRFPPCISPGPRGLPAPSLCHSGCLATAERERMFCCWLRCPGPLRLCPVPCPAVPGAWRAPSPPHRALRVPAHRGLAGQLWQPIHSAPTARVLLLLCSTHSP